MGELDGSVFTFGARGDGVEDLEVDYFSDEEFAEVFTGLEGEGLDLVLLC